MSGSIFEQNSFLRCMVRLAGQLIAIAGWFQHVVNLAIRLWLGMIFWSTGVQKLQSWETTLFLFEYEHPVPFLPPTFAAIVGTGAELLFPVMLLFGFATRIAALGLLCMTILMELTYISSIDHLYWGMMAIILMVYGAGQFSLDYPIRKRLLDRVN